MSGRKSASTRGSAAYLRRYDAAVRTLDSAARMVALYREVEQKHADQTVHGVALVGGRMLRVSRRVGVLAASMNPLSRAHVALARSARASAGLDAVCWVATRVTVDKEGVQRASLVDRLAQASAAARALGDGLALLDGGLYVELARAVRKLLGPDAAVALIVGYDKIVQIFDPRYYSDRDLALRELFAEAEVIVSPRGDSGADELHELLARPENAQFADCVRFAPLESRYRADSSTEARRLAAKGGHAADLRRLLTPEGLALTNLTGAYEPVLAPSDNRLGDRYTARMVYIEALASLASNDLRGLPSLEKLIAMSAVDDARGVALRNWVRNPAVRTSERLRAALRSR